MNRRAFIASGLAALVVGVPTVKKQYPIICAMDFAKNRDITVILCYDDGRRVRKVVRWEDNGEYVPWHEHTNASAQRSERV